VLDSSNHCRFWLEEIMSGSRPENPDVNAQDVTFPETVPDPVEPDCDPVDEGCNPKTGFEPGTEMVPEKGDFHTRPER
jgi:hypothetical protein